MKWRERALIVLLFLFLLRHIDGEDVCYPSSCGKISNISYPFRLKEDPKGCGDYRYEISCENNIPLLSLYSGTFHVQAINYNNFTIRLVDPALQQPNCSFPRYFLSPSNFSHYYDDAIDPYQSIPHRYIGEYVYQHIVFLNCSHAVTGNPKYVDTDGCVNWETKGYIYAMAGDLIAEDFEVGCHVKMVAPTSWWGLGTNKSSYATMHTALVYGFEVSWIPLVSEDHCGRNYYYFNSSSQTFECFKGLSPLEKILIDTISFIIEGLFSPIINTRMPQIKDYYTAYESGLFMFGLISYLVVRYVVGMILFIVLLIYKWRKRHSSLYENIESYLEQNNLMPIRYTYKEIKKMASGFNEKLGEGGYGSVFKGKLRSGPCVAIKMLRKSKGDGQDFINEVATIGRIHHQNVVQLIGYCASGSKRALVYEFMPNGSLDKFVFSKEGSEQLTHNTIYNIAIGVARGFHTYIMGVKCKFCTLTSNLTTSCLMKNSTQRSLTLDWQNYIQ